MKALDIRRLDGFEVPELDRHWPHLLAAAATHEVFQTHAWLSTWWRVLGRGELLLLLACRGETPVLLAPLYRDAGMIYLVGSGGSDYLDFVGDTRDHGALEAVLAAARELASDFAGFLFYHLPETSPTLAGLAAVAPGLELVTADHGDLGAPCLELAGGAAGRAAGKRSLVRHTRALERDGLLAIEHLEQAEAVLPHLEDFFRQHVRRWQDTASPSLFLDPRQRELFRELTRVGAAAGWLRFARVVWNGMAVAYHFGFCYEGRFLWYKPSFEVSLRRRSPGEVLLRGLLLESELRGHLRFDFGLGEESFKARFSSTTPRVHNRGLYPLARSG